MTDKHAEKSKAPQGPLIPSGGTFLDSIAAVTKIGGPGASLDTQFGNGRNPFNVSASELFRRDKLKHGGK